MRLGAFITTLNRPQLLKQTLMVLQAQTRPPDHVLVVDNGTSTETRDVVSGFPSAWTTYHSMGENTGPAGASAYALDRLGRDGYDWLYCGDDDDPPETADTIERLLALAVQAPAATAGVGAVGARWDWARGEIQRIPDAALGGPVAVDVVGGNHHLILRREVLASVGLPDSRLFFGLDDFEYCLRIRAAGYDLLVDGDLMREYRAKNGHLDWRRPRALRPRHARSHIWRQYYSTRNYIFTMTRGFARSNLARRELRKSVGRACLSWGRGAGYGFAFTRLQLRAVIDGYRGSMGRTVLPVPKYVNGRRE